MLACGTVIRQMNREIQHGFLSDEARSRIENIVKDPSKNDKQKAAAVHEIQLEERLKLESENVKSRVRDLVENRIRLSEETETFFFQPAKDGEPDYIQMGLPKKFEGSYLYYGILNHEIEHAIQEYRAAELGAVPAVHKYSYSAQVREKMDTEIGAMYAEYVYFSSIPLEDRQRLANERQVHLGSATPSEDFQFTQQLLLTQANSPKEHVAIQHSYNRYNRRNINNLEGFAYQRATVRNNQVRGAYGTVAAIVLGGGIPTISYITYCVNLLDDKEAKEKNEFMYSACEWMNSPTHTK